MTNEELVERYHNGEDVFETILAQNKWLINHFANKYSEYTLLEKEDLESEFMYILWNCVVNYDKSKGILLTTMFTRAIKNDIIDQTKTKSYKRLTKTISYNVKIYNRFGNEFEMLELFGRYIDPLDNMEHIMNQCKSAIGDRMSNKGREIALAYIFSDLTLGEIGKKYNMRKQSVSLHVINARKILREKMRNIR